jgi:tetratricopeptide (TPR) repeat protein
VRSGGALDRVTTGSLDALRKYTAANLVFDQTFDYSQAIPLLKEAVTIDSTFAMAWRRLAQYYNNVQQRAPAREAAVRAYQYADRLSEIERQLTIATYYSLGPTPDDDRNLAAYEAIIARDSLNFIALNNASNHYQFRREWPKVLAYRLRAAEQPGTSPITFANAVAAAQTLGQWDLVDSLQQVFIRRFPGNPVAIVQPARTASIRGQFDDARRLADEITPRVSASRTAMINHLGFQAELASLRGKVRESLRLRADQRERAAQSGNRTARLLAGFDSVVAAAVVLEDPVRARALLDRAVDRAPLDSIPDIDRNYAQFLSVLALAGDSVRARKWHAASVEAWKAAGNAVERPQVEAFEAAMLAIAEGRYSAALASLNEADRRNMMRTDVLRAYRFLVLDRLGQADSAIAAGESYIAGTHFQRSTQDALFLGGIRERVGEMYEAKSNVDKALDHYTAFVELWKDADPELQPRVREVRARIERLQRRRG